MAKKRSKGTHSPRQRSIQRWENEGGAINDMLRAQPLAASRLKNREKAAKLAGRAIDRLADHSVTSEERDSRKRRLLKGPREFRDLRDDQRK